MVLPLVIYIIIIGVQVKSLSSLVINFIDGILTHALVHLVTSQRPALGLAATGTCASTWPPDCRHFLG